MHLISGTLRIHVMHADTAIRNVHFVLLELAAWPCWSYIPYLCEGASLVRTNYAHSP